LKYYDFNVIKEYWVGQGGRVDIYAYSPVFKKHIGIEISRTSDIRHDVEKLAMGSFDLRFIITDNPSYEGKVEIRGISIPIIYYDNFENVLREVLKISRSHPRFGSLETWLASQRTSLTLQEVVASSAAPRRASEALYSLLEELSLEAFYKDVETLLLNTYFAGELVSRYSRTLDRYENAIDPKLLAIVEKLKFAYEQARGVGIDRKDFLVLTPRGEDLARKLLLEKLSENKEALINTLKRWEKKAPLIAIGTLEGKSLSLRITNKPPLENVLSFLKRRIFYINLGYDYKLSEELRIDPLLLLLGTFASYYFYEISLKFFENLQKLGLAVKIPVYDSRGGRYSWDAYRSSFEVFSFIIKHTSHYLQFDERMLEEFGAFSIILYAGSYRVEKHEFETLAERLGVEINLVKGILEELNRLGITSKYNERGSGDDYPFIVLEQKKFKMELTNKLVAIVEGL
jgi:hypothetical protein